LAFYADVLRIPNSSSYWCPWCLLSHKEWQHDPQSFIAKPRTAKFLDETYHAVKNNVRNQLMANDRKGVSTPVHNKSLAPSNFVPPLLHLEIGLVTKLGMT
jgi:hypothetical protein